MPDDSPAGRRGGAVDAVERIVNREGEADEILRQAVATIAKRFDTFCGIRFVEDGGMIDGPSAGPFSEPQAVVAITYDDSSVAEIALGSEIAEEDRDALDRIADAALALLPGRVGHGRRVLEPLTRSLRRRATASRASGARTRCRSSCAARRGSGCR